MKFTTVVGALAISASLACSGRSPSSRTKPPSQQDAPIPINFGQLRSDADKTCGSLERLNGDSLFFELKSQFGTLGASASARALAAASDQLLLKYYQSSYRCRVRLARDRELGDIGKDVLDDLDAELDAVFNALYRVLEMEGTTERKRVALDSARQAHQAKLKQAYADGASLPKASTNTMVAALPVLNLLTVRAKVAGVELKVPEVVARALADLNVSAGKVQYATQHVAGNTRLAAEMLRNLTFEYGVGMLYPNQILLPATGAMYQVGQQLLNAPEPADSAKASPPSISMAKDLQ